VARIFVITANRDEEDYPEDNTRALSPTHAPEPNFFRQQAATSLPIHVHRIILQARWPHFKRLYSAQMAEYHTKRMHIPEPYSVVRAFLYYLYTDSISGHPQYCADIIDVAGMLVMANLYDMPKLRLLCVNRLSRELDVENAAISGNGRDAPTKNGCDAGPAQFCLANWGRIVAYYGFKSLNRQSLFELCGVVDTEGRIVAGPRVGDRWRLWVREPGVRASQATLSR